jgi:hypothetical protein
MTYLFNNTVTYSGGNVDAFGRLRTVLPYAIYEGKVVYGDQPYIYENQTDGAHGSVTFNVNNSCMTLASGTNGAGVAIRQTRQYFQYVPGKSQLVFVSFCFGAAQANNIKRVGYFDANNGFFFEQSGTSLRMVKRTSSGDGVPDDIAVAQSSWSLDPMNGLGPSGVTLDPSKVQILVIDFQWLGVGRVRVGFDIDGKIYYVHEFLHANVLTSVYINQPSLPVRWECRNTNTVAVATTVDAICFAVNSEGHDGDSGQAWSIDSGSRSATTGGVTVLNVRLKNTYKSYTNRTTAKLLSFGLMATTAPVLYRVMILPSASSLAGSPSWNDVTPSSSHGTDSLSGCEYDVSATGLVTQHKGEVLLSGYTFSSNQVAGVVAPSDTVGTRNTVICQNIACNDSQIMSIWAQGIGGTATVHTTLNWIELR